MTEPQSDRELIEHGRKVLASLDAPCDSNCKQADLASVGLWFQRVGPRLLSLARRAVEMEERDRLIDEAVKSHGVPMSEEEIRRISENAGRLND